MKLTRGQKFVLTRMMANKDDESGELVYESGSCYLGYDRIDSRIFFGLLRKMAISQDQYSEIGELERYTINETGEQLLGKDTKSDG